MALLNNFLELRSDAFKITHHNRRPMPMRTDTIGPWLNSLSFLTWLATLTNSALVYLFRDGTEQNGDSTILDTTGIALEGSTPSNSVKTELLFKAILIALAASHGYIVVRGIVRHLLEKFVWSSSKEMEDAERNSREVKEQYLKSIGEAAGNGAAIRGPGEGADDEEEGKAFWAHDEGLDEIQRAVKDA